MRHALLSALPPEAAHRVAVAALARGLGPSGKSAGRKVRLFGKDLPNRIGLSGGADKRAEALRGWQRLGFGFVEAGTVTPKPRGGNAGRRVWRVGPDAMVNWMGLPNGGMAAFLENLSAFRATEAGRGYCVGASVHSPDGSPDEVAAMGSALSGLVDFMTMNASCPNTEHARSALGGLVEQAKALAGAAPGVTVLVKLGPTDDAAVLERAADAFMSAGVAGFVACNTVPPELAGLLGADAPNPWPTRDGKAVGGFSGPPLLRLSLAMVARLRERLGKEAVLIGVGGVTRPQDLASMIDAGADAVEVYTAVARGGPPALADLVEADRSLRA